jgi:hypothetical protein
MGLAMMPARGPTTQAKYSSGRSLSLAGGGMIRAMQNRISAFLLGLGTALVAAPGATQWAVYEQPTAADWAALAELPDFSGVWERGGGGGRGRGTAPAAAPGAGRATGAGAVPGAGRPTGPGPGAGRAAGGGGRGGASPTPEYAALRDQLRETQGPNQMANCLPPAMPGIMSQPYPMEFLLTPGKVTIVIEAFTQVRHIYTDGRALPEFPDPTFFGTSIGHWEGDTLIVESVGFNEFVTIGGIPHSDELRITERISLVDPDTMLIETTFTDPLALTEPYTTSATFARHRDWTIAEYICQENNRNFVTSDGQEGITLDNPGGQPPPPN